MLRSWLVDGMANSVNPDQTDLDFHCLFSPVCPNTKNFAALKKSICILMENLSPMSVLFQHSNA